MSGFSLVLLAFYAGGAFYASIRQSENKRQLYGGVPLLIGVCIGYMAYSASATAQYGAAATLYIVFFGLAVPLSVLGFGALVFSVLSFLPRTAFRNSIKSVLLVVPIVWVAFSMHSAQERREVRAQQEAELLAERQALFRMTNIEGTLSGFPIIVPMSPQITLEHACSNIGTRRDRTCQTSFGRGHRLRVEEGSSSNVSISELIIDTRASAVLATKEWCGQRTDMEDRIWCDESLGDGIRFYDKPLASSLKNWTEILDAPDDLRIYCQESWNGFLCQSHHVVARNVYVRGWFEDVAPEQVVQYAVDLQTLSDEIWQDITRQP